MKLCGLHFLQPSIHPHGAALPQFDRVRVATALSSPDKKNKAQKTSAFYQGQSTHRLTVQKCILQAAIVRLLECGNGKLACHYGYEVVCIGKKKGTWISLAIKSHDDEKTDEWLL